MIFTFRCELSVTGVERSFLGVEANAFAYFSALLLNGLGERCDVTRDVARDGTRDGARDGARDDAREGARDDATTDGAVFVL